MTNQPPRMTKWIFVFADLLLLAVCTWALQQFLGSKFPYSSLVAVAAIIAWMYGAWICVMPWVEEFRAETKFNENQKLADSIAQIQRIEEVATRIQTATGSWQSAQDSAAKTTAIAREVQEKIKADMKDFMEFSDRVNSEDKKHLQLEIEKLRRAEGDWVGVAARMLDHTFALTQAAHRSNQPALSAQLNNFQGACRDAARRMGLIPFYPAPGDPFDPRAHQVEEGDGSAASGSVISEVLATGYTFQGQLLRRSLVRVSSSQSDAAKGTPVDSAQPAPLSGNEDSTETGPVSERGADENDEASSSPETEKRTEEAPSPAAASDPEPKSDLAKTELEAGERAESSFAAHETQALVTEETVPAAEAEASLDEEQPKRNRRRKINPQVSLPF